MNEGRRDDEGAEPRAEYDFRGGSRGRYADRLAAAATIVMLDPDVAQAFPTSAAVNQALRALLRAERATEGEADDVER